MTTKAPEGARFLAIIVAIGSGLALLPTSTLWLFSLLAFVPGTWNDASNTLGFLVVAAIPTLFLVSFVLAILCARRPDGRLLLVAVGFGVTALIFPAIVTALQ